MTRQKWSEKRSLHFVAEHFEALFNAVRERKVRFAYRGRIVFHNKAKMAEKAEFTLRS
uniref:Uncharacterized protein n=1 Tax=Candidatus Kentrum sp. DK TaxID=2126562 RepID=A0A450RTB4_9GAMM|nr:MAG: hypothetical protein BECKDK2373B_GA0170837_100139 [Candidatus Kentron sp. DK]